MRRTYPPGARVYRGPPTMTRHDAVIVGGGHNGLVAAAYLARAGRSVLVLERREHVGGAAVSERRWRATSGSPWSCAGARSLPTRPARRGAAGCSSARTRRRTTPGASSTP